MPKLNLLTVKQIKLDTRRFVHAKLPETGFVVMLSYKTSLQATVDDKKLLKSLQKNAEASFNGFLVRTAKQLQKFEILFAGMLDKGAPPAAVAKQAQALKRTMESEVPKWENAASRDALNLLLKLAKSKR